MEACPDDHSRTIIHIDIDCFYAQVEELKNPVLKDKPVGVQQKNIIVTCNYKAREHGIKKLMLLKDALNICPNLVLVNGEDLHDYRQYSSHIHNILLRFTSKVEKLGLDENFIDVSEIVTERLQTSQCLTYGDIIGHVYADMYEECVCECHERLILGSVIASEMRKMLKQEVGVTSCAGVSHNKLLAKLVGAKYKPDQQTVLFPAAISHFMSTFHNLRDIPGIGFKTKEILKTHNINSVVDLQNFDFKNSEFDEKTKQNLQNWCHGVDVSVVKPSTKPHSIGLEDSFKKISLKDEVREKFKVLLLRLMTLVGEDGRLPVTVKVTVRKYDNLKKIGHRETKQCPISPSLFIGQSLNNLSDESLDKLLSIIMNLFYKMVNIDQSFHLTLLGLSFTKFQEQTNKSIANFLIKKHDISVQSLTNFVSDENITQTSSSKSKLTLKLCSPVVNITSESDVEPLSKKSKLDTWLRKRKREDEVCSPSKLKVNELSLDSHSSFKSIAQDVQQNETIQCPPNIDVDVFKHLPSDIQAEIYHEYKIHSIKSKSFTGKQSLILKYCISNK